MPSEFAQLLYENDGNALEALLQLVGDSPLLRHRVRRVLNKAARSRGVALSAAPFMTMLEMIRGHGCVPY